MPRFGTSALWGIALLAVVTLGRIPLLGSDNASFVYYTTMTTGFIWLVAFTCLVPSGSGGMPALKAGMFPRGGFMAARKAAMPPKSRAILLSSPPLLGCTHPEGAPFAASSPTFSTGIAMGLFAFLLHDTINFAAFVPGSATPFFALLAVCVAERSEEHEPARTPSLFARWAPLGALAVALGAVLWIAVIPVARADREMALASRSAEAFVPGAPQDQPTDRHFVSAAAADPLDPSPLIRRAEWLMQVAALPERRQESMRLAIACVNQAIDRDPHSTVPRKMLMDLYRFAAGVTGKAGDFRAAIAAAHDVLELYPRSPGATVALADRQFEAGDALPSAERLREAVESYRRALALDDQRLSWEELRRFSAKEREEIESKIDRANRRIQDLSS